MKTLDELIDGAPIGRVHHKILAIGLLIMFIEGIDIQIIGFVAPAIIRAWALPPAEFGIIFSAGLLGATIGAAVLGPFGDRIGRKPLIVAATIVFALGTLATPLSSNVTELVVIRFLASIGLGGVIPNMLALVAEYSPARVRASFVATVATAQLAGGMVGGIASGWAIGIFGWHPIFYVAGAASLVMVPVVLFTLPESLRFLSQRERYRDRVIKGLRELRKDLPDVSLAEEDMVTRPPTPVTALLARDVRTTTLLIWLAIAANLFMTAFVIYWLPTLLERLGMPLSQAILAVSLLNFAGIVGGLFVARMLDVRPPLKVLIAVYGLAALSVGCIGFIAPATVGVMIIVFLTGFFGLGAYAGINVMAATVYPTHLRSAGIGWAIALGKVGSILGPMAATAGLAGGVPLQGVFLISATGGIVAAAALALLQVLRRRDSVRAQAIAAAGAGSVGGAVRP